MLGRGRSRTYTEKQRFIIGVLYIRGHTENAIAALMTKYFDTPMTKGQVSGQINQDFRGRNKLTIAERQKILDMLKVNRADGGILPDPYFKAA